MADFRKWIIVLFALTLLAGLGSAQNVPGNSGMVCNFNQTPTLPIRAESLTDAVSDIIIGCVGGQAVAEGQPIPQATISVTLNAAITSRLIPNASSGAVSGASEALLIIDEPGANLPVVAVGYGTNAAQILCTTPATGCGGFVHYTAANPALAALAGQTVAVPVKSWTSASVNSGAVENVYQGIVTGAQVTFYGVPVLPPGTTNVQRTFRITNVRVNAPGIAAGSFNVNPVIANVQSNNALPLSTPTNTVGFVSNSLTTSLSPSSAPYTTYLQCVGNSPAVGAAASTTLNYKEIFSSAFKTRVVPLTASAYAAQYTNPTGLGMTQQPGAVPYAAGSYGSGQSVPGALFGGNPININSESDFIFPIGSGNGTCNSGTATCAGLADFGTRFKAVFTNIPSGVTVYVAIQNALPPTTLGGAGGESIQAYAQLVSGELAPEVNAAPTGNVSFGGTANAVALANVNGSATAVWEVINANPNALDTFSFPVYFGVTKNTTPAPSAAYVQMWYAPTSNAGGNFSATAASAAQGYGYPIPRFIDPSGSTTALAVNVCQTTLLWPYVVTGQVLGFETGLAISNTTSDPFATAAQNGSCNLWWYGQNYNSAGAVASATATPTTWGCDQTTATGYNAASCVGIGTTKIIGTGQTWSSVAGALQAVPSGNYWLGYVIGTCNFQMAHGYAAITDIGVRNIISSYLALIIQGTAGSETISRGPATSFESLSQ